MQDFPADLHALQGHRVNVQVKKLTERIRLILGEGFTFFESIFSIQIKCGFEGRSGSGFQGKGLIFPLYGGADYMFQQRGGYPVLKCASCVRMDFISPVRGSSSFNAPQPNTSFLSHTAQKLM